MHFFCSYIVVLKRGQRHICLYEAPRSTLLHANKTTKKARFIQKMFLGPRFYTPIKLQQKCIQFLNKMKKIQNTALSEQMQNPIGKYYTQRQNTILLTHQTEFLAV